jgi:hypothetical protein
MVVVKDLMRNEPLKAEIVYYFPGYSFSLFLELTEETVSKDVTHPKQV